MKLLIGCYWWQPDAGSKFSQQYTIADIERLQRGVAKHLTVPHEFVCITDSPNNFPPWQPIRPIEIDRSTHVPGTCFVRLMTFHPDGKELFGGDAILLIDIDSLIVGGINHLVMEQDADLILWRNPARVPWDGEDGQALATMGPAGKPIAVVNTRRCRYNTSVLYHRLGSMPQIWEHFCRFAPDGPLPAKDDQYLFSQIFGKDWPHYYDGERDGVYRLARADTPGSGVDGELPENACIVTFPGSEGKWTEPRIKEANPWISAYL